MTEHEVEELAPEAVRAARDPLTRRIIWAGGAVAVVSMVVFAVSGWVSAVALMRANDEGQVLAQQVIAECDQGQRQGSTCEQAEDVTEAAEAAPAALPGKPGRDGRNGHDGRDGRDGEDGEDGEDGKNGADGADSTAVGPSGAPGSPGADSTVPGPQGTKGDSGRGVKSVECTSGSGEFTFNYDDGTSETVTCGPAPTEEPTGSPTVEPTTEPSSTPTTWRNR